MILKIFFKDIQARKFRKNIRKKYQKNLKLLNWSSVKEFSCLEVAVL